MLATRLKTSEFHNTPVPKSATSRSKNRLRPIRRLATTQSAYHLTTYDPTRPETHRSKIPKSTSRSLPHHHVDLRCPSRVRPEADILLKGGTIIDGTGGKPYEGSVAIRDGHITAVGNDADAATAKQTIDCKGLIICPGFIDLHNHSDSTILNDNGRSAGCYLTQGCTTLVTGNCGGGPTDIAKFYDDLDCQRHRHQHRHARPPRLGPRENHGQRPPRADTRRTQENAGPRRRRHGARRLGHLDRPAIHPQRVRQDRRADRNLANAVAKHGGFYASHIRDEGDTLLESIEEVIEIAKARTPAVPRLPPQGQQEAQLGQSPRRRPSHREGPARRPQDHRRPVSVHGILNLDHGHAPARRRARRRRARPRPAAERRRNRQTAPPDHRQRHRRPRPHPTRQHQEQTRVGRQDHHRHRQDRKPRAGRRRARNPSQRSRRRRRELRHGRSRRAVRA